jgi:hypothetical protein
MVCITVFLIKYFASCGIIVCGFLKLTSARVMSFKNLIFSPVNYSVLADGLIAGFFIGI